jgi:hypothetical protein
VSGPAARTISRLSVKLSDGLKQMIDRRKMFEGFRQLALRICSGKLVKSLLGIPQ